MSFIQKMQCNPAYPSFMAALSYGLLALSGTVGWYFYFTGTASNDFWHWQLLAFLIALANGLAGFSEFVDEESFCPLRDLLDYLCVVMLLPCYAAQMWIKTEMGPSELALAHVGLGLVAALMFVAAEYRRQDLADLAVLANAVSLCFLAAYDLNPIALLATAMFVAGYFVYKREDDPCCMAPKDMFNFVLTAFVLVSYVSLDDGLMEPVRNVVKSITG